MDSLPPGVPVHDHRGKLISPGFIDTHLHYPQTDMIASPAPGLLPWLDTYTFPTERSFEDPAHARSVAEFFLDELLRESSLAQLVAIETPYTEGLRRILDLICEHLAARPPTERDEIIELATALAIRGFADFERKRDRGLRPPDLTVDVVAELITESSLGVLAARSTEPLRATT